MSDVVIPQEICRDHELTAAPPSADRLAVARIHCAGEHHSVHQPWKTGQDHPSVDVAVAPQGRRQPGRPRGQAGTNGRCFRRTQGSVGGARPALRFWRQGLLHSQAFPQYPHARGMGGLDRTHPRPARAARYRPGRARSARPLPARREPGPLHLRRPVAAGRAHAARHGHHHGPPSGQGRSADRPGGARLHGPARSRRRVHRNAPPRRRRPTRRRRLVALSPLQRNAAPGSCWSSMQTPPTT